jgi:hypothetical protein
MACSSARLGCAGRHAPRVGRLLEVRGCRRYEYLELLNRVVDARQRGRPNPARTLTARPVRVRYLTFNKQLERS